MKACVEAKVDSGGALAHDHGARFGGVQFRKRRKLQEKMELCIRLIQQLVGLISQFVRLYDLAAKPCPVVFELGDVDSLQVKRLNVFYYRAVGRLNDLKPTVLATEESNDISGVGEVGCMNANHVLGHSLACQSIRSHADIPNCSRTGDENIPFFDEQLTRFLRELPTDVGLNLGSHADNVGAG